MENQCSHFDTLPSLLVLGPRNLECRMRHPSRSTIQLTIKTLDEQHFIRREVGLVEPPVYSISNVLHFSMQKKNTVAGEREYVLVPRIMFHRKRLPTAVRIDEFSNHQAAIIDRIRFCDCEGVSLHGFDGAPDIDDLYATLHQFVCFLGQMVRHSRECSFVRLVDVHSLHGTAECAVDCG